MSTQIGIDYGTSKIIIYIKGKGIVLKEPNLVAYNKKTNKIEAVGEEAKLLQGRTPMDIDVINPMSNGLVKDYELTEYMLKYFLRKALGKRSFKKPYIYISINVDTTDVEKDAIREVLLQSGARKVYMTPSPIAAALGSDIDISRPDGNMIIDIGAGTTNIVITAFGKIVTSRMLKIGGYDLDKEIIKYIKNKYNLIIPSSIAEELKIRMGLSYIDDNIKSYEVSGRDYVTSNIKVVNVTNVDIGKAISYMCDNIIDEIFDIIDDISPELISDISTRGIILSGGTSLLNGIDDYIEHKTKLPTYRIDEPIKAVSIGVVKYFD